MHAELHVLAVLGKQQEAPFLVKNAKASQPRQQTPPQQSLQTCLSVRTHPVQRCATHQIHKECLPLMHAFGHTDYQVVANKAASRLNAEIPLSEVPAWTAVQWQLEQQGA